MTGTGTYLSFLVFSVNDARQVEELGPLSSTQSYNLYVHHLIGFLLGICCPLSLSSKTTEKFTKKCQKHINANLFYNFCHTKLQPLCTSFDRLSFKDLLPVKSLIKDYREIYKEDVKNI